MDGTQIYENYYKTKPLPLDPVDRANIEHVLKHGYVVLEDCFTKDEADSAKAEIDRLSGSAPVKGRNAFEGFNTNRIYSLLNKCVSCPSVACWCLQRYTDGNPRSRCRTRAFDKFAVLPRVLALNDYFLDPGYMISAFHTIQINPGEKNQGMHHGRPVSMLCDQIRADTTR